MATTIQQSETSTSNNASTPPHCAICLGNCINKCFSDVCMHQFCFKCLLEWSKIKAVCPLCKQPFNKIIHNVKSNEEYDEHLIPREIITDVIDDDLENHVLFRNLSDTRLRYDFFLPTSRYLQFRSVTVDPNRIEDLLAPRFSNHNPFPNEFIPYNLQHRSTRRHRHRDVSSSSYRRSIYTMNLWVNSPPDLTGRYRETSPQFYRDNPGARNRLIPWLNRELNVLLYENTPHVMYMVDTILGQLDRHHVRSRYFKQFLEEFLGDKTDHFIHEFYNFMKSPFDMVGYDRHVFYTHGQPPQFSLNLSDVDESSDSDVALVSIVHEPPRTLPDVIEINSDSSRDSDVIIQEDVPPVVVDLVNSDSDSIVVEPPTPPSPPPTTHKPILPIKIRLKHKRQHRERKSKRKSKATTTTDSDSSDSSSCQSSSYSHKKYKQKRRYKKSRYYIIRNDNSDSDDDSSDDEPILNRLEKNKERKSKKSKHKKKKQKHSENATNFPVKNDASTNTINLVESIEHVKNEQQDESEACASYTPPPRAELPLCINPIATIKAEVTENVKIEENVSIKMKEEPDVNPGPSRIERELEKWDKFWLRPCNYNTSDGSSSDTY